MPKNNNENLQKPEVENKKDNEVIKEKKPISKARLWTFIGGGIGIVVLTLFAIFALQPTRKVSFATNGGSKIEAIIVEGDKIEKPNDPKKRGYDFIGWYDNKDLKGEKFNFGKEITKSITLYAKWELTEYQVKFYDIATKEALTDEEGNELIAIFNIVHVATDDEIKKLLEQGFSESQAREFAQKNPLSLELIIIPMASILNPDEKTILFYNESEENITTIDRSDPDTLCNEEKAIIIYIELQ